MSKAVENLQKVLRQLPGLGYRSAERIALHLLVERPEKASSLLDAIREAAGSVRRCSECSGLAEEERCEICADQRRDHTTVCVVEQVSDLVAFERAAAYRGVYHVLHGKLSPINNVAPADLTLDLLERRLRRGDVAEMILALSNDVEGEATCHYIVERLLPANVKVTRIGFGLPSGGGVLYADAVTLRSALDGRRDMKVEGKE